MDNLRHGDLMFERITEIPEGMEKQIVKSHVMAKGEHTGHAHVLECESDIELFINQINGEKFFKCTSPATIKHQEHEVREFPAGIYRMWFEKEYDYFLKEVQKVQD